MDHAYSKSTISISQAGSLSAAALALHIQAPAVTKRLVALEFKLGVKLFFSHHAVPVSHDRGRAVVQQATGLLASFVEAEEALRNQAREPSGQIRLVATSNLAACGSRARLRSIKSVTTEWKSMCSLQGACLIWLVSNSGKLARDWCLAGHSSALHNL